MPSFEEFMQAALPRAAKSGRRERANALLQKAEEHFQNGVDPLELISLDREASLGYGGAVWKGLSGATPVEILLEALESVQRDQSFDPLATDDTFRSLDEMVSENYDFLIAGHTHLERALQRRRGRGMYMNTGTWARLIRLRPDDLISVERFEPVYKALQAKTMAELDAAVPNRIVHRPVVASVWRENGSVKHALRRVRLANGRVELNAVV